MGRWTQTKKGRAGVHVGQGVHVCGVCMCGMWRRGIGPYRDGRRRWRAGVAGERESEDLASKCQGGLYREDGGDRTQRIK